MNLLIVRHGKAGERDPERWPDDDLRPLTDDGVAEQRAAARAMKKLGITFDALLTSPLLRARQTAAAIADAYACTDPPLVADELGHACTPAAVHRLLGRFPQTHAVALVGHEPALSKVVAAFIGTSADATLELRKGGVAGIRFEGKAELGGGSLQYLLKPGHLRKTGKR